MKIHLHAAAKQNKAGDAYGYGKLYHSLLRFVPRVSAVEFVDDYTKADLQVCIVPPELNVKFFHWWGRKRHPVQVIYTAWEAEVLPDTWRKVLFELISPQAIFTTSHWCVKTFEQEFARWGKSLPVHLVQHGVDAEAFPYFERDWNGELVYLWQGQSLMDRKRVDLVREAFLELNLPDTFLIEKWYPIDSKKFGPFHYNTQRRMQIGQFLSGEDYHELLRQSHVSLNPSRSEGFGMLPLETACTGMATAATNWSGFTDYLNDDCFWKLDYELSEVGKDFMNTSLYVRDFKVRPCRDALVYKEDLKKFMVWCYENRVEAKAMGRRAHEYVKANWTWERAALQFVESCEEVLRHSQRNKLMHVPIALDLSSKIRYFINSFSRKIKVAWKSWWSHHAA